MEGPSRSFCDNGNWTKVPVCLEPCVILLAETRRQNINMKLRSNEDEFQTVYLPRGDSIEFNCKPGHVLATNPSQSVFAFHCRGGPIVYPECKEVVCSRPEVNNGRVSPHRQQYSYEETIQIQCDPGYEPEQRQATSQCTKNGWRPQPKCVSKRCDYPEDELIELNGYSRRYSYYYFPRREGTSIEVRCKSGFLPANKQDWQRSMCTKFGWDPEPKCFKQCEHRGGFPHGRFHNTWNKFIEGNEILFSCDTGYYPEQQEAKAKCTKNGWSPTPRCISRDASCGNPPSITNGGPRNGTQGRYLPGTKVEYYCSEGFVIVGRFSTCRNRSWTRGPTCKEKPCGPPPQVFDASLVKRVKNSYVPGERVHYVCHPGFAANGPLEVACRKGQWTQPPTCEEIVCGDPPTVANADIISGRSEAYKSNHQVQYGCRKGFEMSGSHTVICGFKMWSEPPTCEDVTCPPPNEIDHGGIAGHPKERYMPFDTVRYQCDSGWSLSGPVVVTCIRKQWTNLPRCIDPERNCGRPPVIQNGDVLDPVRALYPPGTTLQYKCQNLYLMNGSSEVRCANGLWTEPPTCIEACIVSEEDMTRNNIQLKWKHAPKIYSASGDVVEFMCRWGYQPARSSPPFRTHCINGRVEYPRCV